MCSGRRNALSFAGQFDELPQKFELGIDTSGKSRGGVGKDIKEAWIACDRL